MRDCIFLVADNQIAAMLRGFLTRDKCHLSLGCASFEFDYDKDILVDPNRDPGVYTRGFELLVPYAASHKRAIVVLDAAWDGAPTPNRIREKIEKDLQTSWAEYMVVVLEPELEVWIWQDNQHVCSILGITNYAATRSDLEAANFWKTGEVKPFKPKEAVEYVLRRSRLPRSSAIYQKIASKISTHSCVDHSFNALKLGLVGWFGAVE